MIVKRALIDITFTGIYWVMYEHVKQILGQPLLFMYTFLAGSIAVPLTMPFDVINTIHQIEFIEKEIITEPPGKAFK